MTCHRKSLAIAFVAIMLMSTAAIAAPITLTALGTPLNSGIGIDHSDFFNELIMSVNYSNGLPYNFERVASDGSRIQFTTISGLTNEIKIACARDAGGGVSLGGFAAGTFATGTGVGGEVLLASPDGTSTSVIVLPGESGLMRGGLYFDRTGVWGGDLIIVTTDGGVWRINSAGTPSSVAIIGGHLEGLCTIPDDPKYGPWAGKILCGAETSGLFYSVDLAGTIASHNLGIDPEDIDLIPENENFYGVNYPTTLWGAPASEFDGMEGNILVAQEFGGGGAPLWNVWWDAASGSFMKESIATVSQWEHVTFSPAGVVEIPPAVDPPVISCPDDTTVECTGPNGAIVEFNPIVFSTPPEITVGGPVVIMGIDAEDGNGASGTGHGGKTPYSDVMTDLLSNVTNGGIGVLVIGGGKSASDDVTEFWTAVASNAGQVASFVNGAANITAQSFAGYAVIAVASSVNETGSGGLTDAENNALTGRASDIALFVNTGGGLFSTAQDGLTSPFAYLASVGSFVANSPPQYDAVTATTEGLAVGVTNTNLDVCCWHCEFTSFPSWLDVLATNDATSEAAAIGGSNVIIPPTVPPVVICVPPSGSLFPFGTTEVCCTAADISTGLVDTCCFFVTVEDTEPPVITCPNPITTNNEPGRCDAVVTFNATARDDCSDPTIVCTPPSGSPFPVGATTVCCVATDAAGNADTCYFDIVVVDNEDPSVVCPDNIVVDTDPGSCDAVVTFSATGADNCLGVTVACVPPSGSTFSIGTTTVTCIATDAAGNESVPCSFDVTVEDNEAPSIICPPDLTLDCGAPSDPPVTGTPFVSDNCDNNPTVSHSDVETNVCGSAKTITRTWTARDADGNSASCDQIIELEDNDPPTLICPPPLTVQTVDDMPPCDDSQVSASDACGQVSVTCVFGVSGVGCSEDPCDVTYQFVATDECGNADTCLWVVTVLAPPCPRPPSWTNGFDPAGAGCTCNCHGDPACDGVINVLDVVRAVNVAFRGQTETADAGCGVSRIDINCDGASTVLDVVGFVNVAFRGGDAKSLICDPCTN